MRANENVVKFKKDFNEFLISAGDAEYSVCFDRDDILFRGEFISEAHCHGYHEIFHVLKGELNLSTNDESITLTQGESAIIKGGAIHISHSTPNTEKLSIQLNSRENPSLFPLREQNILLLPKATFEGAFERLLRYYTSGYREKTELMRCCLTEILLLITEANDGRQGATPNHPSGGKGYRYYLIEQFFSYYGQNPTDEGASLSSLASILNLSLSATQRAVRSIYGISFREKMLLTKETRAKFLLTETDLPVSKISEIQGYSSPAAFSNAFKRREGITPGAYRRARV